MSSESCYHVAGLALPTSATRYLAACAPWPFLVRLNFLGRKLDPSNRRGTEVFATRTALSSDLESNLHLETNFPNENSESYTG